MDNYNYEQEYLQRAIKDMVSYDGIVDDVHDLAAGVHDFVNDVHDLANDVHEVKQDLLGIKQLFAEYMALEQQQKKRRW